MCMNNFPQFTYVQTWLEQIIVMALYQFRELRLAPLKKLVPVNTAKSYLFTPNEVSDRLYVFAKKIFAPLFCCGQAG